MQDQLFDAKTLDDRVHGTPTLTVAELTGRVRTVVERAFGDEVWVQGEIQGLDPDRRPDSHLFFDLVEPGSDGRPTAKLSVALFADNRRGVNALLRRAGGMRMDDGLDVRVRGSVHFWPRSGRVQFKMTAIDPVHTLGALEAERQRVLGVLRAEGLMDLNRARHLALLPRRIAVITSARGAAVRDFVEELRGSGIGWSVAIHDVRVQGREAVDQVAAALGAVSPATADVVVLIRGGGARSDLAAFDAEPVARAIAASPLPVITGLGHEVDRSVADAVAHHSLKTPTACAAWLVDRADSCRRRAEDAWSGIVVRATARLDAADHDTHGHATALHGRVAGTLARADAHLDEARRLVEHRAMATLDRHTTLLERSAAALRTGAQRPVDRARHRLEELAARAEAYDPKRALARGWAIARAADGRVVRRIGDVAAGDAVGVQVADGTIDTTVTH